MDGTAVKDEWHVRDHVGNVRSVVWLNAPAGTGVSASILEQNDYLPFGTRLPGSRTDQSNRYRLGGKEEQDIAGMDLCLMDFGARYYDAFVGRWNAIDPLAHKYFGMSPYNYCGNDPVNFFDPDGMDIWNIDNNGNISHIKTTHREVVRTVDENGKVISRLSLKNANLSIGNLNVDGKNYQYFKSSNTESTKCLFEFIASPSSWGESNNSASTDVMNESSVIYTDLGNAVLLGDNGRVPTASLAIEYIEKGAIFSGIDHVHPGNNPDPSGTGELNGDIGTIDFLDKKGIVFSSPKEDSYHIYTPKDKKYHSYDIFSTLKINPSIVKAKKK